MDKMSVGGAEWGMFGVAIAFLFQGRITWLSGLSIVLCGSALSILLPVPLVQWLHWDNEWIGAFGFFFGLTGMGLCGGAIAGVNAIRQDPIGVLKRLRGISKGEQ